MHDDISIVIAGGHSMLATTGIQLPPPSRGWQGVSKCIETITIAVTVVAL